MCVCVLLLLLHVLSLLIRKIHLRLASTLSRIPAGSAEPDVANRLPGPHLVPDGVRPGHHAFLVRSHQAGPHLISSSSHRLPSPSASHRQSCATGSHGSSSSRRSRPPRTRQAQERARAKERRTCASSFSRPWAYRLCARAGSPSKAANAATGNDAYATLLLFCTL
jgi:hypothetical protein